MADTVAQEITLTTTGGEQAAAAFNSVKQSMTSVVGAHDELKAKFTEKFEHVGLKLFAGEAIKAQGLGGEMRPILSGIMLGMNAVGASFGAAAPEIMLVVAALLAIYEVYEHVANAHEETIKGLEKSIDAQGKEKDALDKVIAALQGTEAAGGNLTHAQENLLKADKALSDHIKGEQLDAYAKLLKVMQDQEAANAKAAVRSHELHAVLSVGAAIWAGYTSFMKGAWDVLTHLIPGYDLIREAVTKLSSVFEAHQAAVHLTAQEQEKLNVKNLESEAGIAKIRVAMESLSKGTTSDFAAMQKAAEDHKDKVIESIHDEMMEREKSNDKAVTTTQKSIDKMTSMTAKYTEDVKARDSDTFFQKNKKIVEWEIKQKDTIDSLYAKDVEYANKSITNETDRLAAIKALDSAHSSAIIALHADTQSKIETINEVVWDKFKKTVESSLQSANQAMGSAIAKMVVEGKSFQQSMNQLFITMAEKFIESVVMMVIEWLALQAVMSIWPGGAQAYQATANAAYPAVAQAAYNNIGAQADGGTYYADKPTVAVFGEAGPEVATFTPVSKLGASPNAMASQSSNNVKSSSQDGQTTEQQTMNVTVGDINISLRLDSLAPGDRQMLLRQLGDEVRTASVDAVRFAVASSNLANKNSRVAV